MSRPTWLQSVMGATSPATMPEPQPQEAHDPREAGNGVRWRCLDCGTHGGNGNSAFWHHRIAHHRIVATYAEAFGPMNFSCCSGQKAERIAR